jgi:ubiquinone/menaquinone biosynthesis C-methylase UbiE
LAKKRFPGPRFGAVSVAAMRDRWDLTERLFAAYYPRIVQRSEDAGQRETRGELLADAAGATLEIGAGTGINLEHYTPRVTELVLSEPSPYMLSQLHDALRDAPPAVGSSRLVAAEAQALPFGDQEFQTVVCTYVLCSVPDPQRALAEISRVVAPGGSLLFL